jgi:hypothetical protein
MMGGEAGSQEDMFAKLDSMRAVITEVNTQFKDPVSHPLRGFAMNIFYSSCTSFKGKDHFCLRLHF